METVVEPLTRDEAVAERTFRALLANSLISGVTSSFLWFALTFWIYLETRSVVATAIVGAAYGLSAAVLGPAFGTYVDVRLDRLLPRCPGAVRPRRGRAPAELHPAGLLAAHRPHPARIGGRNAAQ